MFRYGEFRPIPLKRDNKKGEDGMHLLSLVDPFAGG